MCPAVPWPAPPPTRLGPPPERGVDATAPPVCGVGMTRQTSPAAAGGREREGGRAPQNRFPGVIRSSCLFACRPTQACALLKEAASVSVSAPPPPHPRPELPMNWNLRAYRQMRVQRVENLPHFALSQIWLLTPRTWICHLDTLLRPSPIWTCPACSDAGGRQGAPCRTPKVLHLTAVGLGALGGHRYVDKRGTGHRTSCQTT